MKFEKYLRMPLVLEKNRMKRAFIGGMLLDQWQGIPDPSDGNMSEEWLVSDIEILNADRKPGDGLSKMRLSDGSTAALKEIVSSDPVAFLGREYVEEYGEGIGVLSRAGDSTVRLVLQAHPDAECARKYYSYKCGKTEAWYIVECRELEGDRPHVYAGLKPGTSIEKWRALFDRQDIACMLEAMHKVYIKKGDMILIEAGMPHAMGKGSLFLEVHEPSDYTLRLERNYLPGRTFTDDELHLGAGLENMFKCISGRTYTEEEIRGKIIKTPVTTHSEPGVTVSSMVTYEDTPRFKVDRLSVNGEYRLKSRGIHQIAIAVSGEGIMTGENGSAWVRPGHGIFLPAYFGEIMITGRLEMLVCDPPKPESTGAEYAYNR